MRMSRVALCIAALCSPLATAQQDLFKSLKDIGKAIEKSQTPQEKSGPKPQRATEKSADSATKAEVAPVNPPTYCLDDICLGDGIEKLTNIVWLSLADWRALSEARQKSRDKGLAQAIGKQRLDQERKRDQFLEQQEAKGTLEERLRRRLKGRLVASPNVVTDFGRAVLADSAQRFDNSLLPLLTQFRAICLDDPSDTKGTRMVGAIKRDSPNKTLVLIEIINDGPPPMTQRFAVTSITRVFDIDASDQGAMVSLAEAVKSQFGNVYVTKDHFYKNGLNLQRAGNVSVLANSATLLYNDPGINVKARPELIVTKNEYDGNGTADERWKTGSGQMPDACKQSVRID